MKKIRARAWDAGRRDTLTGLWAPTIAPIDADLRNGLQLIRQRAREAAQNNDHIAYYIKLLHDNIVGPNGIIFQSQAMTRTGKPDERVRTALEQKWRKWTRPGNCDMSGRLSWRDVCRLMLSHLARDGEGLLMLEDGGGPMGFAVHVLDPEMMALDKSEELADGRVIRMGVEMDRYGRPLAYWLRSRPGPHHQSYRLYEAERVDASRVLHIYLPEYAWQTRGVPWIATSLMRLHHLGKYEEAELAAARVAAEKPGHYKKSLDAVGAPAGEGEDSEGQFLDEIRGTQYGVLPPGWDFQIDDVQHPTSQFPDFVKSLLRSIASGLGVGYNQLANDLEGVNYTSLRMAAIIERSHWQALQEWFIESLVTPVYERWLSICLGVGSITYANGEPLSPMRFDQYAPARWQARRWPWVDPLKEIAAVREAIDLRTKSISQVIREAGDEPDEVWAELAADMERLEQMGIPFAPSAAPMMEEKEEEPEEEDDETEGDESEGGELDNE